MNLFQKWKPWQKPWFIILCPKVPDSSPVKECSIQEWYQYAGNTQLLIKQESIPVGCVLPAFVVPGVGVVPPFWDRTPQETWDQTGSDIIPCPLWTEWQTRIKHYLPATSFADGKEQLIKFISSINKELQEYPLTSTSRIAPSRICFTKMKLKHLVDTEHLRHTISSTWTSFC